MVELKALSKHTLRSIYLRGGKSLLAIPVDNNVLRGISRTKMSTGTTAPHYC